MQQSMHVGRRAKRHVQQEPITLGSTQHAHHAKTISIVLVVRLVLMAVISRDDIHALILDIHQQTRHLMRRVTRLV